MDGRLVLAAPESVRNTRAVMRAGAGIRYFKRATHLE